MTVAKEAVSPKPAPTQSQGISLVPLEGAPPESEADELTQLRAKLKDLAAARLRDKADHAEELAEARGAPPAFVPGKRYRVTLPFGPTAIVEPRAGQHPTDRYREVTGLTKTEHQFTPTPTEDLVDGQREGVVRVAT